MHRAFHFLHTRKKESNCKLLHEKVNSPTQIYVLVTAVHIQLVFCSN